MPASGSDQRTTSIAASTSPAIEGLAQEPAPEPPEREEDEKQ
jgi:hypothetical protein